MQGDPVLSKEAMIYPGSCTQVIEIGLAAKYKDPAGNEYKSPFLDEVREAFTYTFDARLGR